MNIQDILTTAKAIVFDLDDTLYPERDYIQSGFQAVAQHLANPTTSPDTLYDLLWTAFEKGPRDRVFNTVLKQLTRSDDQEIIAELINLYRRHHPKLQLAPPISHLLIELRKRYKLALISDGFLPAQQLKVEALGLTNSFDSIIFTEQLGREFWKPSPVAFEMTSKSLNCPPHNCVYIADNLTKDFIAPNQLNWSTVQLINPGQVHKDTTIPPANRANVVINDLTQLLSPK